MRRSTRLTLTASEFAREMAHRVPRLLRRAGWRAARLSRQVSLLGDVRGGRVVSDLVSVRRMRLWTSPGQRDSALREMAEELAAQIVYAGIDGFTTLPRRGTFWGNRSVASLTGLASASDPQFACVAMLWYEFSADQCWVEVMVTGARRQ